MFHNPYISEKVAFSNLDYFKDNYKENFQKSNNQR